MKSVFVSSPMDTSSLARQGKYHSRGETKGEKKAKDFPNLLDSYRKRFGLSIFFMYSFFLFCFSNHSCDMETRLILKQVF